MALAPAPTGWGVWAPLAEPRETNSVHFQSNVKKGSAHEELLLMRWPAHDHHMHEPWPAPTLRENGEL